MSDGVMLVKSFIAGIGENIINRLQVAFYRPARRFYIFSYRRQKTQTIFHSDS